MTMLDWSTGLGTAKYWVNDLLLSSFSAGLEGAAGARVTERPDYHRSPPRRLAGDIFVVSNATDAPSVPLLHTQGWVHLSAASHAAAAAASSATVLLIVKEDAFVNATVELRGLVYGGSGCALICVDETTALGPALPTPVVCSPADGTGVVVMALLRPYASCVLTLPMASPARN